MRRVKGFYTDDRGRKRPITKRRYRVIQRELINELRSIWGDPINYVRRGKYLTVSFNAYYDDGEYEFPYNVEVVFPLDDPSNFQLKLDGMTITELRKKINNILGKISKAGFKEYEVMAMFDTYYDPDELIGKEKALILSNKYGKELKKLARLLTLETLYDEWDDTIGNIVP